MSALDVMIYGSGAAPFLLEGGQGTDLGTLAIILFVILVVIMRLVMLGREHAMRTRCRHCGAVFDMPFGPGFRIGLWRYGRCPACDKASLFRTGIKAPLSWPMEEAEDHPVAASERTDEDEIERRIRDSKYE